MDRTSHGLAPTSSRPGCLDLLWLCGSSSSNRVLLRFAGAGGAVLLTIGIWLVVIMTAHDEVVGVDFASLRRLHQLVGFLTIWCDSFLVTVLILKVSE